MVIINTNLILVKCPYCGIDHYLGSYHYCISQITAKPILDFKFKRNRKWLS